jgi:polyisoprenoid-binding protein YceI
MHATALLLLLTVGAAAPAATLHLEATPAGDGVRVKVAKSGLFSAFAHDHDFEVTRWRGTVELPAGDPARVAVELVLAPDSLRDREKGLSEGDRHKVEGQAAGPAVLDAGRFPEITFRADRADVDPGSASDGGHLRGVLHGLLTLHGVTRPVEARFEATREGEAWHARGEARLRQSEFGIKPFSGAGGTVGVKDELEVKFDLTLRPGEARAAERTP